MSGDRRPHQPVLYQEVIDLLRPQKSGHYVDATLGAGGHAEGILAASDPDGILVGLDLDMQALEIARQRLSKFGERAVVRHASYAQLEQILKELKWSGMNGILFDLGVSSMQLETPERGFSFLQDGPLDMRFDSQQELTAQQLVNEMKEEELAKIIWEFGEEPQARKIAAAIIRARPLSTTHQLADLVGSIMQEKHGRIHPATLVFQALRIAVNSELQNLKTGLDQAIPLLIKDGRIAVISFHSLEDRMVKQTFQRQSRNCICPPEQPICTCGHVASLKVITRHAIKPSAQEVQVNPRARSAHLRVAQKVIGEIV